MCIPAYIDNMQQNSKTRLCDDMDKKVIQIINKCSKMIQKEYKHTQEWEGKGTHKKLCKRLKFDHSK